MNLTLDKVRACIYGYAIGDALGVGTEFMTRDEATRRYPGGLRRYEDIIRDAHRSQFKRGDFTLDTEVVVLLIEAVCQEGGVTQSLFARLMKDRYEKSPYDFGGHLRWVMAQPDFLQNPEGAAKRVWDTMINREAYNEALGRAMILGMAYKDHRRKIVENCRTTHYDPRCVASAVVIGDLVHEYIRNGRIADADELIEIAEDIDSSTIEYIRIAENGDLSRLQLDDEDSYWYTRKTMAAALWAFWHAKSTNDALYTLVDAGGDADTNAALGCALVAMREGFDSLPTHLVENLLQRQRIERAAKAAFNLLHSQK